MRKSSIFTLWYYAECLSDRSTIYICGEHSDRKLIHTQRKSTYRSVCEDESFACLLVMATSRLFVLLRLSPRRSAFLDRLSRRPRCSPLRPLLSSWRISASFPSSFPMRRRRSSRCPEPRRRWSKMKKLFKTFSCALLKWYLLMLLLKIFWTLRQGRMKARVYQSIITAATHLFVLDRSLFLGND